MSSRTLESKPRPQILDARSHGMLPPHLVAQCDRFYHLTRNTQIVDDPEVRLTDEDVLFPQSILELW